MRETVTARIRVKECVDACECLCVYVCVESGCVRVRVFMCVSVCGKWVRVCACVYVCGCVSEREREQMLSRKRSVHLIPRKSTKIFFPIGFLNIFIGKYFSWKKSWKLLFPD